MPTSAATASAGYMFTTWPASPPVFESIAAPQRLFIPLSIYLPTEKILFDRAGESCSAGERIMPPIEGAHAALAPVAGRALGLVNVMLPSAEPAPAIEFETASSEAGEIIWPVADDMRLLEGIAADGSMASTWIDRLRHAGVWAARRGSPDLLAQLHQALRRPIDTVVCSILDGDPSACLNAALAAQYPLELVAGTILLRLISQANRAWIAVDARIPATWSAAFRRASASHIKTIPLANQYPQADPTLLLYTLLNRRLRPGRLPTDQGVILLDAAAAIAVGRVVLSNSPMLSVPLAVRDHALRQTFFVFAPIGTPVFDVIQQTRVSLSCTMIRGGDVLRDLRVPIDGVVGGSELILQASPPEPNVNPEPCIRCGWCLESCPTRVQPAGVLEAAQHDDVALAEYFGIEACIECGICSYVCPSRLPLLGSIHEMRETQKPGG